jgi:hypothetical protein
MQSCGRLTKRVRLVYWEAQYAVRCDGIVDAALCVKPGTRLVSLVG